MKYGTIAGVRYGGDIEESFRIASEIGFDGVEVPFQADDYTSELLWTAEGAAHVRVLAERYGLETPSCVAGRYNKRGFAAQDPEIREEAVTVMLGIIDGCAEAGIDLILTAFFGEMALDTDQQIDWAVEGLKRCAPRAESRGITLALEGTISDQAWLAMLERIDSGAVAVYYDVANAMTYGFDSSAEMPVLMDAGVLAQIHIKDMTLDRKNMPLGEGDVDFDAVSRTIKEIGYDGYLVLETPVSDDPAVDQKKYLEFTRAMFE